MKTYYWTTIAAGPIVLFIEGGKPNANDEDSIIPQRRGRAEARRTFSADPDRELQDQEPHRHGADEHGHVDEQPGLSERTDHGLLRRARERRHGADNHRVRPWHPTGLALPVHVQPALVQRNTPARSRGTRRDDPRF